MVASIESKRARRRDAVASCKAAAAAGQAFTSRAGGCQRFAPSSGGVCACGALAGRRRAWAGFAFSAGGAWAAAGACPRRGASASEAVPVLLAIDAVVGVWVVMERERRGAVQKQDGSDRGRTYLT